MSAVADLFASYSDAQVKEHDVPTAENEGSRGAKQSVKRQPTPQDLETDCEEVISDSHSLEDVLAPVTAGMGEDRPISTSISPESHSQTKNSHHVSPSLGTRCGTCSYGICCVTASTSETPLIALAEVKHAKEPSFELVKRVREIVTLDDCTSQDDDDNDEPSDHVWNDTLVD